MQGLLQPRGRVLPGMVRVQEKSRWGVEEASHGDLVPRVYYIRFGNFSPSLREQRSDKRQLSFSSLHAQQQQPLRKRVCVNHVLTRGTARSAGIGAVVSAPTTADDGAMVGCTAVAGTGAAVGT